VDESDEKVLGGPLGKGEAGLSLRNWRECLLLFSDPGRRVAGERA